MPNGVITFNQKGLENLTHRANAVWLAHQPGMKIQGQDPTALLTALVNQQVRSVDHLLGRAVLTV